MTATLTKHNQPESRRAARHRERVRRSRRRWLIAGIVAAVVALIAVIVVIVSSGGGDETTDGTVLDVELGDYTILGDLTAPAGHVTLHATNVGVQPHDVGMAAVGPTDMPKISGMLTNGQSVDLDLGVLAPGTYQLFCDVGDHIARGMVATLTVTEAPAASIAP